MNYTVAAYKQLESLFLPSVYFVLHLTLDFLLPEERHQLTVTTPVFVAYAQLHQSALMMTIHSLHFPRQQIGIATGLMHEQAWKTAVTLPHFDFHYGDLIRWMGGEYTNAHRDWLAVNATIDAVWDIEPPDSYPCINFNHTFGHVLMVYH
jgi:hypothetical protein